MCVWFPLSYVALCCRASGWAAPPPPPRASPSWEVQLPEIRPEHPLQGAALCRAPWWGIHPRSEGSVARGAAPALGAVGGGGKEKGGGGGRSAAQC